MASFNKSKIKSNFNKAAAVYQEKAILQKIVAEKLVLLNSDDIAKSKAILDLGSGTGFLTDLILSNFTSQNKNFFQIDLALEMLKQGIFRENIFNINADIEFLPFRKKSFDLIISSLSFQWLNDLKHTINEALSLLQPQGVFSFSIISDESLKELKIAKKECGVDLAINNFLTENEIKKILGELENCKWEIIPQKIILEYEDLYQLLKSIKEIGAGYGRKKLTTITKNDFEKVNSFYLKNLNLNNRVPATWQVYHAIIKPKSIHA